MFVLRYMRQARCLATNRITERAHVYDTSRSQNIEFGGRGSSMQYVDNFVAEAFHQLLPVKRHLNGRGDSQRSRRVPRRTLKPLVFAVHANGRSFVEWEILPPVPASRSRSPQRFNTHVANILNQRTPGKLGLQSLANSYTYGSLENHTN